MGDIHQLFWPKSVAVIGASTKELSIGNRIIRNLQDFGYKGKIFAINPKGEEVRGLKPYASILEVEEDVELAHIVIPNKYTPMAVDDCGKKGVKMVIINSAGFKEVGGDGEELEKAIVEKAKEHGIRLFGPNCQGVINSDPQINAYCNFTFTKPTPGNISIVAQSGGVGEVINQRFSELGIGVRMYASNGNACDISINEVMEYWRDDDQTKVIVLYLEGLSDPDDFMRVAREVAARKPILGMKAGRTAEGAKAASSHTGGLAKEEMATELIMEKCGIVTFRDEEEMVQAAAAFATQPIPKGNRVGIITNTGGPAIIATDEFIEAGLEMPPLSDGARSKLKESLYSAASINNPIDVLATANATHFRAAVDTLMDEDQIDSVYINFVTPFFVDNESIARELVEVNKQQKKPIICNLMTDKKEWAGTINILTEGGIPCYSFPETAARSLVAMSRYNDLRSRDLGKVKTFDVDKAAAESILAQARESGRSNLSAAEVYGILDAYKIPVAPWKVVGSAQDAVSAAENIGYPVVVKADSEKIVHKSDVGGVAVNLVDADAVRSAVDGMQERFETDGLSFLVQKFMPGGKEVIVGAKSEGDLGHMLMFGMGGTLVELIKDVSWKVAPLSDHEAGDMMRSLKQYPVLEGYRGDEGVKVDAVLETIQRASQLVTDLPAIAEMDLNPVMAFPDGAHAVDARISI